MSATRSLSRREVTLGQGDVACSAEPALLQTVLGSCVAVCLWDMRAGVGGMNHFVLPGDPRGGGDTRYGSGAMAALLAGVERLGGCRGNVRAKVFGGAAVLPCGPGDTVGDQNVRFARDWLARNGVPVVAERTGGVRGQQVRFDTATGDTFARAVEPMALPA